MVCIVTFKHPIKLKGEISLKVTIQTMKGMQPLILHFVVAANLRNETREALICYNELVMHQIYVPGINGVTIDDMNLSDVKRDWTKYSCKSNNIYKYTRMTELPQILARPFSGFNFLIDSPPFLLSRPLGFLLFFIKFNNHYFYFRWYWLIIFIK